MNCHKYDTQTMIRRMKNTEPKMTLAELARMFDVNYVTLVSGMSSTDSPPPIIPTRGRGAKYYNKSELLAWYHSKYLSQ